MYFRRSVLGGLCLLLVACGFGDQSGSAGAGREMVVAAEAAPSPAPTLTEQRTLPDPACPESMLGGTGVIYLPEDPGFAPAASGGQPAAADVLATLPEHVLLSGTQESYTDAYYYAVRQGRIYVKANEVATGVREPWRTLLLPRCLDGHVSALSGDAATLIALDEARWLYTLDLRKSNPQGLGWTRRWGPVLWMDFGMQMFADVQHWATSDLSPDLTPTYTDSAGRQAKVAGILTVYTLRGDNRLTYLDPWLPSDESREVCPPENGQLVMAGLAASGSTVMVAGRNGEIYTRLYEFDVSGGNTVFLDYSWQDQEGVASPKAQLPAPDWRHHPRIPGTFTNRLSMRQISGSTDHRIMRVEGRDKAGQTGYWQRDIADAAASSWKFVVTNEPLRGTVLPLPEPHFTAVEAYGYSGTLDGHEAVLKAFQPYCSPASLQMNIAGTPLKLTLHSTDGLRQLRRARGLDGTPHNYRGAVEVPAQVWAGRAKLPQPVQDFLSSRFGDNRILQTPLTATRQSLQIMQPCWTLTRDSAWPDSLAGIPDPGSLVGELLDEQEQGRQPPLCRP